MFKRYFISWSEEQKQELVEHLRMNGYHFDVLHNNMYVYEEETQCVETIMNDRNIEYKEWD